MDELLLRRLLPVVAGLLLCDAGLCQSHRPKHHSVNEAKTELSRTRSKKHELQQKLRQTHTKVKKVKRDLNVVEAQLDDTQQKLEHTQRRLSTSRVEQARVTQELAKTTKELEATRKLVRDRLRAIYVEGGPNAMSGLLGSRTGGDAYSRPFLTSKIAHQDRALFERFKALQQQVSQRKKQQDALVVRVTGLVAEEKDQKQQLSEVREEKAQTLKGLTREERQLYDEIAQMEADEREIERMIASFNRSNQGGHQLPAFTGRFSRPVEGPITSGFGSRYHPILHKTRSHDGIDFGAHYGATIHAAADGQVITVTFMRGYGRTVIIDHGGGISTLYAHTSAAYVQAGQRVRRGERIAAVGKTGLATGPHLHWEVRVNGRPVNPMGRL